MAVKCILTGQTPSVLDGVTENVQTQLNDKVDKITGKGLSTNDYTSTEKTKLSGIEEGAQKNTITGVKGSAETTYRTGNVNITATNIGLGNVNNTSDAEKPISTATQTALDGKQATITGAATTITDNNLTANRALISNSSGKVAASSVTSTELGYLDGVTSNIQTQLNNKLSSAPVTSVNNKTGAVTLAASDVGAQSKITANGILKGDGSGNITAANETEVKLVSLPNICNPNLLDNWYFGNPVNQRGQTSYAGTYIYTIDRWKANDTITVVDGGIKIKRITSAELFCQPLSDELLNAIAGKVVTCSVLTTEGLFSVTSSCPTDVNAKWDTDNAVQGNLVVDIYGPNNGRKKFRFYSLVDGTEATIIAVKLELGSQQTLAHRENGVWVLNEIPDYGEQLRKCQRYYWRSWRGEKTVNTAILGESFPSNYRYRITGFSYPVEMREKPSIIISGTNSVGSVNDWSNDAEIACGAKARYYDNQRCIAVSSDVALTDWEYVYYFVEASADL